MSFASRILIASQTVVVVGLGALSGRAEESAAQGIEAAPAASLAPGAEEPRVELEPLPVFSSRVALQEPTSTFAAPVSALRYEPQVDVQARNFAEGQADLSIRGGTSENTGFAISGLPIYDPQTGHYTAELPVTPHMLRTPEVRTGAEQAAAGFGATSGSVNYGWRPLLRSGGVVSAGGGGDDLARGEIYAAVVAPEKIGGFTVAADVSAAFSRSDGTIPDGDHDFHRYNGRVQLANGVGQTDLFAGYQSKFFGWPNLYARGNNPETENLQTKLFVLNHRAELGADGDYVQFGAYYRGNRDDYEYNRRNPGQFNPYEHQTLVRGVAADGRVSVAESTAVRFAAGVVWDDLDSTSLTVGPTNGRFMSRTQGYASLQGERTFALDGGRELVATAGARLDDSDREESAVSPVARLELRGPGAVRSVYASYSETTQVATYQALNASSAGGLFLGDRDLGRSRAATVEAGLVFEAAGWTGQAAVFFQRDDDQLDYVFSSPASARRAVAVDVDTIGLELFARRSWERVDLLLGYTYLDKDDDYLLPNGGSFYVLNYAEHRLTVGAVARLGGGVELRVDNELRRQARNALRSGGDDNVDTAIGLYYRVPAAPGLVLNAQVENLWDNYFEDVPTVPGSGRLWSVGASYAW